MNGIRRRLRTGGDAGFGLIETVIALLIAGVVFSALAAVLVSAVQASLYGRQNQQATDFMTRQVEKLRALDFGSLANTASDIAGADPRLSNCAPARCLSVNGVSEPVVTAAGGVTQHISTINGAETNNTGYTVSQYVTQIAGQPVAQARRATVYITWMSKGVLKTRSISTVIAYAQRGLPLPQFRLDLPVPSVTVHPTAQITYALTLTNQGAPDHWNLTIAGPASGWLLFADTNGNGTLDNPSIDKPLIDTTADGITDTGLIDPSTTFRFFLTRSTNPSEPLATTQTTITATSVGQPTATGAVKSVVATTVVTAGVVSPTPLPTPTPSPTPSASPSPTPVETTCAAPAVVVPDPVSHNFTLFAYALHSNGVGDTPLQPQMSFTTAAASQTGLPKYSTDIDPVATGRVLAPMSSTIPPAAAVLGSTDATKFADWALQFSGPGKIDGTGVVHLWVANNGAAASGSMKVELYTATGSMSGLTRTVQSETTVSLGPITCTGFQEFYIKLPTISNVGFSSNGWVGVRVVTFGTGSVRLGYDEPSQFPASFTIGVK